MTEAHLPRTGSIEVVKQKKAAKLVERVARDTENPELHTEHLLIVLDIDGTVLLEDESLSPGVVEAVEHAHRAGHEVMLATGRSWEGTRRILEALRSRPSSWCAPTARSSCAASRATRGTTSASTPRRSIPRRC